MYTSTIYISLHLRYNITFMKLEKVLNFVNKKTKSREKKTNSYVSSYKTDTFQLNIPEAPTSV